MKRIMIEKKKPRNPLYKGNDIFLKKYEELPDLDVKQDKIIMTDTIFNYILEKWFSNDIIEVQSILQYAKEIIYKFGTKEWAEKNFNTHYACIYACWNCYAWNEAYQRQRPYWKDWGVMMSRRSCWNKKWKMRKNGYWIMYPATHDILPEIMNDCFQAIQNILNANINVLWVTKPCKKVISSLVDRFHEYRKGQPRIKIRMTIGTDNDKQLVFWEPKAPLFQERFESLKMAYKAGYETSVSCEPFYPCLPKNESKIEIENFVKFVQNLLPYVKETLWIGMMNHIPIKYQRGKLLTNLQKDMILKLKNFYILDNIKILIKLFYMDKKIRWKESIKKTVINSIINSKI